MALVEGGPPRSACRRPTARRGQRGVSLMEALVAIVVLSIGLFSAVLVQLNALRSQRAAHAQTTAVQLAGELAERMRANVAAVAQAAYADPASQTYMAALGSVPALPGATTGLSPATQALLDLARWKSDVALRLGAGTGLGLVRLDADQPYVRQVVVMWRDRQPTPELAEAAKDTRPADCSTVTGVASRLCDARCPSDGTVAGAPVDLRCVVLSVQP